MLPAYSALCVLFLTQDPAPLPWPDEGAAYPELLLPAEDVDSQISAALGIAVDGDYEAALAYLDAVLAHRDGQDVERLHVAHGRIAAVRDARDSLLASLAGTKRRLRLVRGDEEIPVSVESVEAGEVRLGRNKAKLERIPLADLGPRTLRASMGRKVTDHGPEWVGAYLDLLLGEEDWRNSLGEDEGSTVLALAGDEIEVLVLDGRTMARLAALAGPIPTELTALERLTTDLSRWLEADSDLALVIEARPGLRALATEAWTAILAHRGDHEALAGKASVLADGRWVVRYDFDDPAELGDFSSDDDYMTDLREALFELTDASRKEGFAVRDGALAGSGAVCLRHRVSFTMPSAEYRSHFAETGSQGSILEVAVNVGICDDGRGSHARAFGDLDLEVRDRKSGLLVYEQAQDRIAKETVDVTLAHEGERIVLYAGDTERHAADAGPLHTGDVFLWMHSNVQMEILHLEIVGRPDENDVAVLRDEWVAARVAAMGLAE